MGTFDRVKDFFGMNPETIPAAGDEYYDDDYEAGEYGYTAAQHDRGDRLDKLEHRDHDDRGVERRGADRHGVGTHSAVARAERRFVDSRDERASARFDDEVRASGYDRPVDVRPRRYSAASAAPIRGAVALQPEVEDFADYDDGLVVQPETVLERPRGYGDGKSVGENFRDGRAVVLDLSLLQVDDARRMIDFAAGLVFALDGRMAKVTDRERTFFMQPQGMDLTEAEMRATAAQAFRR